MTRLLRSASSLVLVAAAVIASSTAFADDHYFFIRADASQKGGPILQIAALDLTDVDVQIFGTPGGAVRLELPASTLFASLDLSTVMPLQPGEVLLGRASSVVPVSTRGVVLTAHDAVQVAPLDRTIGTGFIVPVGDISGGASLVIGNPSFIAIDVDLFAPNNPSVTTLHIPANSAVELPLSTSFTRYVASSQGPVGFQPAFMTGLVTSTKKGGGQLAMVPPL